MAKISILVSTLLLAGFTAAINSDVPVVYSKPCTRAALKKVAKNYIEASGAYPEIVSTIDVAIGAKVSQNNEKRGSVMDTALSYMIAMPTHFQLQALDTTTCTVATVYVPVEARTDDTGYVQKNETALTSIRISMNPEWDNIEELEIVNALPGSHPLFAPETLPDVAPALWTENTTAPALSREELIKLVDTYPSGIQAGSGADVQVGSSCVRYENGVKVPLACNGAFDAFKYPVLGRRWVVDTETGVVLGMFFFDKQKVQGASAQNLQLHEYFKVDAGKIDQIFAVMNQFPGAIDDFWSGAKSEVPNNATVRWVNGEQSAVLAHHKRWSA